MDRKVEVRVSETPGPPHGRVHGFAWVVFVDLVAVQAGWEWTCEEAQMVGDKCARGWAARVVG